MNVRWRLGLAALQIAVLVGAAFLAVGTPFPFSIWFVSGLLGVVLALQLSEPFFTRPTDVLVSAVSVILLVLVADRSVIPFAWWGLVGYCIVGIVIALLASVARRDSQDVRGAELSFRAYQLMRAFAGKGLYSAVFVIALLSEFGTRLQQIVILSAGWAVVVALSAVRWDQLFLGRQRARSDFECIGMVAPSRILLVGRSAEFRTGEAVAVERAGRISTGHVTRRLPRSRSVLVEVLMSTANDAEELLGHHVILRASDSENILGVVGPDTTDELLVFKPLAELTIGSAVVATNSAGLEVVHQIAELRIANESERAGGSEEVVRASAVQVGEVSASGQITLSRRILQPGTQLRPFAFSARPPQKPDKSLIEIGEVLGTDLPVHVDLAALTKGHMAVLGMTGMGKSTFTRNLALELGKSYPVVVVDQTGEYRKLGLPAWTPGVASTPGVSLKDLNRSPQQHQEALTALETLEKLGRAEFDAGAAVLHRILIIEEAHQFVPEPAMLGFNAPGRDESFKFGLLMMQVRKFGVSVVLVSQRTAVVAKSALSQCENIVAFKSVDQTGLDYLGAMGGSTATHLLPRLRLGEAVLMGPAMSTQSAVGVRLTDRPGISTAVATSTPSRTPSAGSAAPAPLSPPGDSAPTSPEPPPF